MSKKWSEYTVGEKIKIIVIIVMIILFIVFAGQNWEKVKFEFMIWQLNFSLFVALLFSFLLGILVSFILSRVKTKPLKKVIHLRNEEIKSLKFELANKQDIKGINSKVDQLIDKKN